MTTIRVYEGQLFEVVEEPPVSGYVLDSDTGKRKGKLIKVPPTELHLTGNDQEIAKIMKMSATELLDYIMESPDNLTDSYYSQAGNAVRARHEQLKEGRP